MKFKLFLSILIVFWGVENHMLLAAEDRPLSKDESTITGKVWIHEIDENDFVKKVYIESGNERYIIVDNSIGQQLMLLLGDTVKVTGKITMNEDSSKLMEAMTYEKANDIGASGGQ